MPFKVATTSSKVYGLTSQSPLPTPKNARAKSSRLRRLPVSILKIDKSFIDEILADTAQAEYVGFIIDLAHALHLRVVAEGVEIPAQIDKLQELDCDAIQGFVFSHPLPEAAAVGLLAVARM